MKRKTRTKYLTNRKKIDFMTPIKKTNFLIEKYKIKLLMQIKNIDFLMKKEEDQFFDILIGRKSRT